jgi:hypothetical protein
MQVLKITISNYSPGAKPRQILKTINSLILNFTTMKKSILILVLAVFASVSVSFGQAVQGNAPRDLENCVTGPLNPIAGVPYDYSAFVTPIGGNDYWFATFNPEWFIQAGGLTPNQEIGDGTGAFISSATNYRDPLSVAGPDSTYTTITWKTGGLAQITPTAPLFVGLHYTDPPTGCADNLKVYKIEPLNAFLVNILNRGVAYNDSLAQCFSDIAGAVWNGTAMDYDFGINIMPFEVVAANFTGSYELSFRIEGLQNNQQARIHYSYDIAHTISEAALLTTVGNNGVVTDVLNVTTALPSTENGVSVYVWLEILNNDFQGLANTPVTLAVAGTIDGGSLPDIPNVRWNDCSIEVDLAAAFSDATAPDYAVHALQPRPTVTPGSDLNFVPQVEP